MIAKSEIVDLWFSMVGVMSKGPRRSTDDRQQPTSPTRSDERKGEAFSARANPQESIDRLDQYDTCHFVEDASLVSAKA